MNLLGLDIATKTGYCLRTFGSGHRVGTWDCTPRAGTKKRPPEPEGVRFRRLYERLSNFLDENAVLGGGIDAAIIEEGFSKSRRGWQVLGGLIAVVEVALEQHEVPYVFVNASTLKAFARREDPWIKGDEEKERMRLWALRKLGGGELTTDEADAYWLVRWGMANLEQYDLQGQGTLKL